MDSYVLIGHTFNNGLLDPQHIYLLESWLEEVKLVVMYTIPFVVSTEGTTNYHTHRSPAVYVYDAILRRSVADSFQSWV